MSGASNHAATDLRGKCLSLTDTWNLVTIFVHLGVKTLTKQVNPQLTIAIKIQFLDKLATSWSKLLEPFF